MFAQNEPFIIVKGMIQDQSSQAPLPYANISVHQTSIGTVSNQLGNFQLKIPATYAEDSLSISFIGYESILIPIQVAKEMDQFSLPPFATTIETIVVKGETGLSILKKAIDRIPQNYAMTPFVSGGFYRVSSKKNEKYIHLSEAVFDLYNSPQKSSQQQFKLNKMRAIKDESASHGIDLGLKGKTLLEFDLVQDISSTEFLNKKGLKRHTYKVKGTTFFQDSEAYIIEFDQKENDNKVGYKGRILIDKENYAFLYFDIGLSPKGITNFRYGDGAQRMLMKLFDIHIFMEQNDYQITYKKIGSKYFLSSVGNDARLSFKSSRSHFDFK